MNKFLVPLALSLCSVAALARADAPIVTAATATSNGMGWTISVTIEHPDTGWDHFADGWEVLDEAGNVLGFRKLHHPHVDEQPFTRSLNDVMLPDGTRRIFIRTKCSVDGLSHETFEVTLKR